MPTLLLLFVDLSLEEKDVPTAQLTDDLRKEEQARLDRCLVGKVLSSKAVNKEAFQAMMMRTQDMVRDVVAESLGENKFVFCFLNVTIKQRVLLEGPWLFK